MKLELLWKRIMRRRGLSIWLPLALLLWLASYPFRLAAWLKRRMTKPQIHSRIPVISVGNISVGGTGKTPMTAFLGTTLIGEGYRVGIVSSGYRRTSSESIMEEGYQLISRETGAIGDELKLLAHLLPGAMFSVADTKSEAVMQLDRQGEVDVILVDDGFQHYLLHRDLDLVTYDAAVEKRMLHMFPYGVLREPLSSLKRAQIIVITRSNFARDITRLQNRLQSIAPGAEIYKAQFQAEEIVGREQSWPAKYLEDKSVFLFAGIGNFNALKKQVAAYSADLDYAMELSDHQEYDERLLEQIKSRADRFNSDLILTTGKDWMKLGSFDFGREIYYLGQTLDLDPGEEKLTADLITRLKLEPKG